MFTGTGLAQPISGAPLTIAMSGNRIVPIGSACTSGLSDTRPSSRAVGSPRRSAVHACAISCTVSENSRTMSAMKICETKLASMPDKQSRLRPTREKRKDGVRRFRPDNGRELLARRAPHARHAPERRQQRLAPPGSDARHAVELGSQIAHRARTAMERDREAMGFVADALNQQQRRVVGSQRDRILAVARVDQLFFL